MKKLIIFYTSIIFFMMTGVVLADVVSKNPNYLKRGKIDKVHIANYLKKGPDKDLLEAEKTKTYAGYIRGLQRIGGFGGKSE